MRRVVVTGLGMVSPLGNDVASSWEALLAGKCGIGPITRFDASAFGSRIAGEVKGFDASLYLPAKEARRYESFILYGVAAGIQALDDAGLDFNGALKDEAPRAGCVLGSGIGGLPMLCEAYATYLERGPRRFSPFLIPGSIINLAAGQLSIMRNLQGPNLATVSACSTGLHAIGEASWMIRRGDADVIVAGGCEGVICPDAVGGFDAMHALSRRNDDPEHASRPFDKGRDGFVIGEGAGVLVLEDYEHAVARGAKIYCELAGYGLSADAHHITTPSTEGPVRCMRMALEHAGLAPEDIDFLNAHGTSTPVGDVNESKAVRELFGERAETELVVTSTKGATGHLLGGAGGIEAVFTVKAVAEQIAPPTINLEEQDPECRVNVCANAARPMAIRAAMKNNFGFGGTNATLVFKRL
ncbi:MAG: beta-ketoacyl-ACP synthase II [Duodenibacillus sp.]|nr:beta-ketoacyl-ACP synthase II [Duodenibacillus sp.]